MSTIITPKLVDLSVTTPFLLQELYYVKRHYHLTDHGVEKAVELASLLELYLTDVIEIVLLDIGPPFQGQHRLFNF